MTTPNNTNGNRPTIKQKVSGVVLIDKPQGMTSQQVVSKVKWLFKSPEHDSKKAGHTGTLDPMATGLLPVCLGEATKFSHYQLDADKSYVARVQLGTQTDTGDAEGKSIATASIPNLAQSQLNEIAQAFMGEQLQTPPMYSALKKDGKKLYEYARAGIEVEREPRPISIKNLELKLVQADVIELTVTCSKGTYVRVLGEDVAKGLGTLGHLTALRRTSVGDLSITNAITLTNLEALALNERFEKLLSPDVCLGQMPTLVLTEADCQRLRLGQRLNIKSLITTELEAELKKQTLAEFSDDRDSENHPLDVRLYQDDQQFVGLGVLSRNGRLQPKKMLNL